MHTNRVTSAHMTMQHAARRQMRQLHTIFHAKIVSCVLEEEFFACGARSLRRTAHISVDEQSLN